MIAAIFGLSYYFKYRTRHDIQNTVRAAIDKGQELSPEVLERLSDALPGKYSDLRRGVLAIALGVAFFCFGFLVGEEEAEGPMMAISTFPFLIGVAYLAIWNFTRKQD
jgi:hypothetical protein